VTQPKINIWVASWVTFCARHAKSVCLLFVVLCVLMANYTVENLGINTKTTDMLSEKLAWRQNLIKHEEYFPYLTDTLVAVIDAQTPMLALQARDNLAAELRERKDLFDEVYLPGGGEFFRQHGLLYLELEELDELTEQLAKIQPFLGRLQRGERLSGYLNLLEQSLVNSDEVDPDSVKNLLSRTAIAVSAVQQQRFHRMRWNNDGSTRQLIILKPKLVFEQLLPAKQSIQALQDVAIEQNLTEPHGVNVRLTGTIALQSDELKLLAGSMPLSGLIALVLVSLVLFFAMRHPILILSSVTTLVVGLIITAAFAAFAVGQLNLVSVAFAILFIGLGVDFAIHFCLRYKELIKENIEHIAALRETGNDVGASLLLCAITTSAGFFAFIPTSFKGVSELGVISGAGIIISLITTLSLLPALLSLSPIKTPALFDKANKFARTTGALSQNIVRDPKRSKRILVGFSILIIACLCTVPFVSFDNNPMNLRSPKSQSVSAYLDLLNDASTSPLSLSAINSNLEELNEIQARLQSLDTVERVVGFGDFVPQEQADKLDSFADLEFILGGRISSEHNSDSETPEQQLAAISSLIEALERQGLQNDSDVYGDIHQKLSSLRSDLQQQPLNQQVAVLNQLSESLLSDLLAQIQLIQDGLTSNGVSEATLPEELVKRWKSDNGYYKIQILPSVDMSDNAEAGKFVRSVTALAPNATGASMVNYEGGQAIVQSFQQAFASAFVLIFLLLLLLLRKLGDAVLVLTPLILTAPLIVAVTVLLGTSFHYANVITLPLLLGISVDNGVHIVHRARHALPSSRDLLASSTGRAVVFSALTTVVSFGNLAFSPHVGTASMGLLLTIGMICSLFCTLLLLPILLHRFIKADSH